MSRAAKTLVPFWLTQDALTPAHGIGSASSVLADAADALYFEASGAGANALAESPAAMMLTVGAVAGVGAGVGAGTSPTTLQLEAGPSTGSGAAAGATVSPPVLLLSAHDAVGDGTIVIPAAGLAESPALLVLAAHDATGQGDSPPVVVEVSGPRVVRSIAPDLRLTGRAIAESPPPLQLVATPARGSAGAAGAVHVPPALSLTAGVSRGTGVQNPSDSELAMLFDLLAA